MNSPLDGQEFWDSLARIAEKVATWPEWKTGTFKVREKPQDVTSNGLWQRHGEGGRSTTTREYRSWTAMKSRCYDAKKTAYRDYGGRGISVCPQWLNSYPAFLRDMGRRPPGTSLDRIDVNGNYEPGNCRWASTHTQRVNQRPCVRRKNWTGTEVGGIMVLAFSRAQPNASVWLCQCLCGKTFESRIHDLTRGKRKSCGSCTR